MSKINLTAKITWVWVCKSANSKEKNFPKFFGRFFKNLVSVKIKKLKNFWKNFGQKFSKIFWMKNFWKFFDSKIFENFWQKILKNFCLKNFIKFWLKKFWKFFGSKNLEFFYSKLIFKFWPIIFEILLIFGL